ncbi:uncharacterized protein [Rutidosis leptorrhynchoides]|uniref:uncharacterized protein n=1 Tax=Rutidosis leptorrhynchoides TaxID=125765 RepID=UPI003A993786
MKILSLNVRGFGVAGKFSWGHSDVGYAQKHTIGKSGGLLVIWDNSRFKNSGWVLCGDFNEVRDQSDRLNCVFHEARARRFNEFIIRNNLIEIPINGRKFTRISDDGTKFSKFDRFLVSDNFIKLWDDLSITVPDRRESDHCPLVLRDGVVDFGPKPFKIFDEWLTKEGVDKVIIDGWNKNVRGHKKDCIFRDRLKNVKSELRNWSKIEFGNLDAEINSLKDIAMSWELKAEKGTLTVSERLCWLESRKNWISKDKIKLGMLKQKARVHWTLDGDENSKFFHSTMRIKYNKNNIRGLNVNGSWCEDPIIIKSIVREHFQKRFSFDNSVQQNCRPRFKMTDSIFNSSGPSGIGPLTSDLAHVDSPCFDRASGPE